MSKLKWVVLLGVVAVGGWYYSTHYEVEGLPDRIFKPRDSQSDGTPGNGAPGNGYSSQGQPPVKRKLDTIRIASFNLGMLDRSKLGRRHVARYLAEIIRRFDVLAVQDIRADNKGILLDLIERVNSESRHYDFATSPGVGRDDIDQYSALLFDRASVEIDRRTAALVNDPAGRFRRRPLVAAFRVRGPAAAEAFTFTLINVHIDPSQAAGELELLDDVFRTVRDDGRGEDDIIMLGDFETDDHYLARLGKGLGISRSISGVPSTTRGGRLSDNILFDRRATVQFTGRSGALDLMREFDLSMQEALEVSDHLPVWAEFSVYEGGQAGHVATGANDSAR